MTDFAALLNYSQQSFVATVMYNIERYTGASGVGAGIGVWRYGTITGLFLLGLWVGRARILQDIKTHRSFIARVAWMTLPAGLCLAIAQHLVPDTHPVSMALLVGTPILAIGYVAAGSLFLAGPRGDWLRWAAAPAGQMALTLYLLGGFLGEVVFYGWGFDLMASIGDVAVLAITIVIFAALIVASHLWMRRFKYGPFEWVWRCMTHLRPQPMRR